jgi:hypothetical protein
MALPKNKKPPFARSPSQQPGKADIRLIYKALRYYPPTEKEAQLHDILVESFEELLATEYIELPLGEE